MKQLIPTEDSEQAALFDWARMQEERHPALRLMHAIPNGGYRHMRTAVMLKRTGVKAGVPDIFLPVARGCWHGLFIEMKRTQGGVVSANQKWWMKELTLAGYKCVVCKGFYEARAAVQAYINGAIDWLADTSVAAVLMEEE